MLKHEYEQFCQGLRLLAMDVGIRPACRALGIKETQGLKIASRRKWNLSKLSPAQNGHDTLPSSKVIAPIEAKLQILQTMGDRTRLAMGRTAMRAFERCDELKDDKLHDVGTAIALDKHRAIAATAHNWSSTQNQVAVQVNVPMPSQAERDEMRQLDAKLDAFAKLLKDQSSSEAQ